jgi:hypothetical protein
MSAEIKKRKIIAAGDKPLEFDEISGSEASTLTAEQKSDISRLADVFQAYKKAAKNLLGGKYVHLAEYVPSYLFNTGNTLVALCYDGVVVRYDSPSDNPKMFCGWMEGNLCKVAALLSQNLICCYSNTYGKSPDINGLEICISKYNHETKVDSDISRFRIRFEVPLDSPDNLSLSTKSSIPRPIASVRNSFEVEFQGELLDKNDIPGAGKPFIKRSEFRLGVGWECIEIFPKLDVSDWVQDNAIIWAERDILAAVAAHQFRETQIQALDPNAGARKQYSNLLKEFKLLLDSNPNREEILQVFLRENPAIICPTYTRMWPKLPLGAKKTDFVFRDAIGDYILVEIERSTHSLFRSDGHPRQELTIACSQILDWKRYIEDNLSTVQHELGLEGISTSPRSFVIIGRNESLSTENRRKLRVMENEQPKLRIMTYDDLYDNAKAMIENLLGPIFDPGGRTQINHFDHNDRSSI